MKVLVGLGNPGEKYAGNRHNAGFIAADLLGQRLGNLAFTPNKKFEAEIAQLGNNLMIVKPQTFMNDSGRCVSSIVNFYKIDLKDLYIIHDDLDIQLGKYKLVFGSGPKAHNGINSIQESLGSKNFWYGRVGVENRPVKGNKGIPGIKYSLEDFTEEELSRFMISEDMLVQEIRAHIGLTS
jgi:PTH1 family peptidyl-tRNA hydrolase